MSPNQLRTVLGLAIVGMAQDMCVSPEALAKDFSIREFCIWLSCQPEPEAPPEVPFPQHDTDKEVKDFIREVAPELVEE